MLNKNKSRHEAYTWTTHTQNLLVHYSNTNTYILGNLLLKKLRSDLLHLPRPSYRKSSSTSQTKPSRPHVVDSTLFIRCISLSLLSHGAPGVKLISNLHGASADSSESHSDWCLLRSVNRRHFYASIVSCHNTIRSMVWSSQFISRSNLDCRHIDENSISDLEFFWAGRTIILFLLASLSFLDGIMGQSPGFL